MMYLICTPLPEKRCDELGLEAMVSRSTDPKETALRFLSIYWEMEFLQEFRLVIEQNYPALMDEKTKPTDFMRPGHIFPFVQKRVAF